MSLSSNQLVDRLGEAGVKFTLIKHRAVYNSFEAAEVRGTPLHSGAKALVMHCPEDFVMAVMPADLSLDSGALRKLLGIRRLRFATKEELLELSGLTPGSIPPFGSLLGIRTICDERLAENELINFNAASHTRSIRMRYADYVAYEKPRINRIAKAAGS